MSVDRTILDKHHAWWFILLLCLLVAATYPAGSARAGLPAAPTPGALAPLASEIDEADARTQAIAAGAHSPTISDADLRLQIAAMPDIKNQLHDALAALQPRLQAVDAKLAELGPAPASGQPAEDPEVAHERQVLLGSHSAIDTEVKLGGLVSIEAKQLEDYLVTRRKSLFSERLWRHDRSPFDPRFWTDAATALSTDLPRVAERFDSTLRSATLTAAHSTGMAGWILSLIVAIGIAGPLRMVLNKAAVNRAKRADPDSLRRSLLALSMVTIAVSTTAMACVAARAGLAPSFLQPSFEEVARSAFRALVFASLFAGLGRALLQPDLSAWRIAPIADAVAIRERRYPAMIGLAAGIATVVSGVTQPFGFSEASATALHIITLVVEIAVIGSALSAAMHANADSGGAELLEDDFDPPPPGSQLSWVIVAVCGSLALVAASAALLIGYLSLATFVVGEMIWIATMLGLLFVFARLADHLFPALTASDARLGKFLRRSIGLGPSTLEQLGVLLSGTARLAVLLFGWTAILAPFGAGAGDVLERLGSTELVFHLGQVAVSPGTIVGGLLVFVVAIVVTRAIRRWLEVRYLPKTALDIGARSALSAGVGYAGAIIAIVVAASYLGLSLDRITLFASALSVGIGFGLQSVIGNFVSGLILLAERPVKVGDWIAIGDLEGDVRRISVRATEIEMRDRSKLIVPNFDLISKTVRNVTHGSSLGRLKIVLRVKDETDPDAVRSLIMARLHNHPAILAEPSADVFLTDVRDGALEFTSFAYVASPRDVYRVRSELLFEIVPELKASDIALANSTPVVNVGLGERPMEPGFATGGADATRISTT